MKLVSAFWIVVLISVNQLSEFVPLVHYHPAQREAGHVLLSLQLLWASLYHSVRNARNN